VPGTKPSWTLCFHPVSNPSSFVDLVDQLLAALLLAEQERQQLDRREPTVERRDQRLARR